MTRSWPLGVALLALAAPLLRAQDIQDTIVQKDNTSVQGEVIKETFKEVTYSLGKGVKSGVNRDKISRVDYASKPSRYDEAMGKTNGGQYAEAADSWDKVLKECDSGGARKIFKQHAFYYGAQAYAGSGNHAKAIDFLNSLFTDYPDSMFFVDGYNLMAECYLASGKYADAIETAKKGSAKGKELAMPEDMLFELDLVKARSFEAQKKYPEAQAEYKLVSTKAARFPAVAARAKLGVGRCYALNGQYGDAETYFNEIADKAEEGSVLAGAYNGLGDCWKVKFEKENNAEHLRKALMAYMRGVVLYTPSKGGDTSEHGRSLVNAGYCFEKLKDNLPTPEAKKKYADFARNLYKECIANYRGTKEAGEAENRLKRLE